MKSLTYLKITIILTVGFLLASRFFNDVYAASDDMTLSVENQLGCKMHFTVTTTWGSSSFGAEVGPGQTYTTGTFAPLNGNILSSIKVGPAFGPPYYYNASGLALSGHPFKIVLNTQGVVIFNKFFMPIHTGLWTGGPCPK
jgi:hypothetical protein